jgi:Fe2+ transport system protein FeoA
MLSDRNRVRLRRFGRRFFLRPKSCRCRRGDCIKLEQLAEGRSARVTCNNDLRTIERGLYHGVRITSLRNSESEPNIVIAVGDSRYVLDRRIASQIMVRVD